MKLTNLTGYCVQCILGLLISIPIALSAEIEETVLGMNVSGNKEAPNLLYIIPWKESSEKASPPDVYRLMDEIYSTVDPDVFQKEVSFFEQLQTDKTVSVKDDQE